MTLIRPLQSLKSIEPLDEYDGNRSILMMYMSPKGHGYFIEGSYNPHTQDIRTHYRNTIEYFENHVELLGWIHPRDLFPTELQDRWIPYEPYDAKAEEEQNKFLIGILGG